MSLKANHQHTARLNYRFPEIWCWTLFLALILILISTEDANSQTLIDPDAEQLRFIIKLYDQKEYHRSISQILKIKFQFPQTSDKRKLDLYLLKNYYWLREYHSIDNLASEMLLERGLYSDEQINKQSSLILIASLLQQGEERRAQHAWETYLKDDAEGDFPSSEMLPDLINPDQASFYSGLLPGSGFLLSEAYGKAFVSLALNLIFISGSYQAFTQHNYGISGLLMFFEISWYFGGKKASAEAALQFNRKRIRRSQQYWIETQLEEKDLSDLITKSMK